MSEARIPAHIEVSGLIRAAQAAGGFGMVLAKGERDAGTLLVICCDRGAPARAYERMPQADGSRKWVLAKAEDAAEPGAFTAFWQKRVRQDGDLWVVELDVANAERFIGVADPAG